jgi:hypothetical protein
MAVHPEKSPLSNTSLFPALPWTRTIAPPDLTAQRLDTVAGLEGDLMDTILPTVAPRAFAEFPEELTDLAREIALHIAILIEASTQNGVDLAANIVKSIGSDALRAMSSPLESTNG